MSNVYYPPSYQTIEGYRYRLDRWHYSDDYQRAHCEYVLEDDIPYADQRKYLSFDVT